MVPLVYRGSYSFAKHHRGFGRRTVADYARKRKKAFKEGVVVLSVKEPHRGDREKGNGNGAQLEVQSASLT
jgi:hypothetical protein